MLPHAQPMVVLANKKAGPFDTTYSRFGGLGLTMDSPFRSPDIQKEFGNLKQEYIRRQHLKLNLAARICTLKISHPCHLLATMCTQILIQAHLAMSFTEDPSCWARLRSPPRHRSRSSRIKFLVRVTQQWRPMVHGTYATRHLSQHGDSRLLALVTHRTPYSQSTLAFPFQEAVQLLADSLQCSYGIETVSLGTEVRQYLVNARSQPLPQHTTNAANSET